MTLSGYSIYSNAVACKYLKMDIKKFFDSNTRYPQCLDFKYIGLSKIREECHIFAENMMTKHNMNEIYYPYSGNSDTGISYRRDITDRKGSKHKLKDFIKDLESNNYLVLEHSTPDIFESLTIKNKCVKHTITLLKISDDNRSIIFKYIDDSDISGNLSDISAHNIRRGTPSSNNIVSVQYLKQLINNKMEITVAFTQIDFNKNFIENIFHVNTANAYMFI